MQLLSERSQNILNTLKQFREHDAPTHGGRVFSYVYDPDDAELERLMAEAIALMQPVNGLDPTVFTSVSHLEQSVLSFMKNITHAPQRPENRAERVWGTVTAGGTESCMIAVKAARELWKSKHPNRAKQCIKPNIVAPTTVHAAFHKAASYFDLELRLIPIDPLTKHVDADTMIAAFDEDTALAVVSAPSYPHGVIDPIAEVAAAAHHQNISCHVDACFGGLVLPWWPDHNMVWDFRIPGVTSISADLHKYGYAPKGVSVLLQRGDSRHRAGYFAVKSWPGYPVANPTLLGSKSAGPLAAAWAIIEYLGEEGFRSQTEKIADAQQHIANVIDKEIIGLALSAESTGPVITVQTDESVPAEERIDPHHLSDRLSVQYGWETQQQPGMLQSDGSRLPGTTHLTITPVTQRVLPEFLRDLKLAAEEVRGIPRVNGEEIVKTLPEPVQDLLAQLTDVKTYTDPIFESIDLTGFLTLLFQNQSERPERPDSSPKQRDQHQSVLPPERALLTALIEVLPAALVERLLIEVLALQSAGELG